MKKVFLSMLTLICSLSLMATQTAYVQIDLVGTSYPAFSTTSLYLTEDTERSAAYESGYDSKDASELNNNYSVLLYAFVGAEKCSSVATNDLRGLQIGFTTNNVDTEYKLQFSDFDGNSFYLFDKVLNKLILINSTTPDYAFTAASGQVEVNDRFVINTIAVIGTESAWWETEYNAILTIAGETATGSITFPAGKVGAWYNFKVVKGDQWLSNKADFTTNHSQIVNAYETENMFFQITLAGEYTFTWNFDDNTLTIGFPALAEVTTNAYGLATFSFNQNLVASEAGVKLYKGEVNGEYLDLNEVDYVKAGEGVIVYGEANTTYHFNAGTGSSDFSDNELLAATDWTGQGYVLSGSSLYTYTGVDFPANKAFLAMPSSGPAPKRISFRFNQPTAVENAKAAEVKAEKFVENGQIFIRRGNEVFNLQGQIVK